MSRKEYRETIFSLAEESLAKHIIKKELSTEDFNIWLCRNPDNSFYWYRVICVPGCVIVQGDVGNKIFSVYDRDVVAWLKGAVNSPDYLMSKCEDKHREFIPGAAEALLKELEADDKEQVDKVREDWVDEKDSYQFSQAFYNAGFDTDYLSECYDYNSDVVWSYACLKKFVQLLSTQATTV